MSKFLMGLVAQDSLTAAITCLKYYICLFFSESDLLIGHLQTPKLRNT